MPTQYTSLLGLALPITGELTGAWGDVVNDNITELVEDAIAATATQSVAAGDWTLSTTGSGAPNEARCAIIIPTGSPGVSRNVIAPAKSKAYVVVNQSNAAVVFKSSATAGVTLATGEKALVAWNGADYIKVSSSEADGVTTISFGTTGLTPNTGTSGAVTVAGTLAAANGGTGASSYATGDTLYASGATTLSKLTIGTNGQVMTVTGGVPTWANPVTGLPSQTGNAGKYLTTDGTNASWSSTGAAAGGAIYVNNTTISQDYTIGAGQNGFTVGPVTVASGYAVTVSSGQRWVVL